jgi:hypothetical protein
MADEIDLWSIQSGSVTAPAGCGKTHLIATSLLRWTSPKPVLILTHTNAGVVALRGRLSKLGVPAEAYRLHTIDGWCMRVVSMFPARSGITKETLKLRNPSRDYDEIRHGAMTLIAGGHLDDLLLANYSRLLVDEYQDCSMTQHTIVRHASRALKTCVLGDPLQTVFNFRNTVVPDWNRQVCGAFPSAGILSTPWRWENVGAHDLGDWLLQVRRSLLAGQPIDLSSAPNRVSWVALNGLDDHPRQLSAAGVRGDDKDATVLVMGESTNPLRQRLFASQIPGAISVESVDLKDFVKFAENFDPGSTNGLGQLLEFAENVMTNVGARDLLTRVATLSAGQERKEATEVECAAIDFLREKSFAKAASLLSEISRLGGVRSHRPGVLSACIRALIEADPGSPTSLHEAAMRARERNRYAGRSLPRRGVGSTLTLKGLEADIAVILDVDGMNANHLYVAMTRGSKRLIVCSKSSLLSPGQ